MKKRLKELDIYSGIAIIFVIMIHSNSYYLTRVLNSNTYLDAPYLTQLLDIFIHTAVPMFIFISGYKFEMNDNGKNFRDFFIRKVKRVLKPFLILSLIYILFKNILILPKININSILSDFIGIFLGYNKIYHFWYIPMYLFVSIIYYFIYRYIKNNRTFFIGMIVILWKILSVNIIIFKSYPISFIYYLLFYEIGVISCKYRLNKISNNTSNLLIIIYFITALFISFINNNELYSLTFNFILAPISVVSYYLISVRIKECKILDSLGRYSWYIFVLHEPVINGGISRIINFLGIYNSFIYVFIISVLTIVVTVLVCKFMKRNNLDRIIF